MGGQKFFFPPPPLKIPSSNILKNCVIMSAYVSPTNPENLVKGQVQVFLLAHLKYGLLYEQYM